MIFNITTFLIYNTNQFISITYLATFLGLEVAETEIFHAGAIIAQGKQVPGHPPDGLRRRDHSDYRGHPMVRLL